MKKVIIMLMLFVSATTVITSCKKEDKKSEKEKTLELLTSGKWYYNSFKNTSTTYTCFTAANYWEFKTDGTFEEHWDFDNGTYTLSEDGKTLVLRWGESSFNYSITSINNSELKFTSAYEGGNFEFNLSKNAPVGCP